MSVRPGAPAQPVRRRRVWEVLYTSVPAFCSRSACSLLQAYMRSSLMSTKTSRASPIAGCRTFFAGFCALHSSSCESATSDSSLVPPLLDVLAALNTLPLADSLALLPLPPESDALALVAAGWLVRGSKLGCVRTRTAFCALPGAVGERMQIAFLSAERKQNICRDGPNHLLSVYNKMAHPALPPLPAAGPLLQRWRFGALCGSLDVPPLSVPDSSTTTSSSVVTLPGCWSPARSRLASFVPFAWSFRPRGVCASFSGRACAGDACETLCSSRNKPSYCVICTGHIP